MEYTRQQIEEDVLNAFSEYKEVTKSSISLDDDISKDLGLDSLDRFEVMIELEMKYETNISGNKIASAVYVKEFADLIENDLSH